MPFRSELIHCVDWAQQAAAFPKRVVRQVTKLSRLGRRASGESDRLVLAGVGVDPRPPGRIGIAQVELFRGTACHRGRSQAKGECTKP